MVGPERKFSFAYEDLPVNLQIDPYEVRDFSLRSLTKRLRVLGIRQPVCDEMTRRGIEYYEAAWNEYETLHQEDHPRRFYDRLAPVSGYAPVPCSP
ncbi:MAG: hypothetical protein ABR575_00365 [Actinomycetota bacterium]